MQHKFFSFFTSVIMCLTIQAQFTVPDPTFVLRLQNVVPNAMNGNILDTNHVDVVGLDELSIFGGLIYSVDGIQFFDSLEVLNIPYTKVTTLPTLPSKLRELYCFGSEITSMPTLPASLEILHCYDNQLPSLPALPSSLVELQCQYNYLTSLPPLSASLRQLQCANNQLTLLPNLPDSLVTLRCTSNPLSSIPPLSNTLQLLAFGGGGATVSSLPPLPDSLKTLFCGQNQLVSLPSLPDFLEVLYCNYNPLTSLPSLPNTLKRLVCSDAQLSILPVLPGSLERLWCNDNQLTTLPVLPASLTSLYCENNQLVNLPQLSHTAVSWLQCHNNQLASLPDLPNSLSLLYCQNNPLTELPALSPYLSVLYCYDTQLNCLPLLPNNLGTLRCYNTGVSCLPNIPTELGPYASIGSTPNQFLNIDFVPNLCSPSDLCFVEQQAIFGTCYLDANGNGVKEFGEVAFLDGVAEAQPGNYLSGVDLNGSYGIPVQVGSYTVQGQPVLYHTITTAPHNVTITAGNSDTANHIGYQAIPGIYDLVAQVSAGVTRPGFDNNVYLQVKNIGTEATTASISFDFDAVQTWVSANNAPDTQNGNNATWNLTMQPGDCWSAAVTLNTPPNVALLGTPVQHVLNATPGSADQTPADNVFTFNDVIVGAYDPNDKLSSVPSIVESEVQSGTAIDYTIRFQNTGTFLAENVLITDTLSQELQTGSFTFLASSHPQYWYIENDVLHIRYDGIQLPDSTSDEPGSHGFFKFRIAPETSLVEGDSIVNVANIYFDFNEPVITEANVVHIEGEGLLLNAQVFLGGPYDQVTGLMNDGLRAAGLVPLTEPYTAMGYVPIGTQPNGTIDANVLQTTGNDAIVDWVIVELRPVTNNTLITASRYGLLQRDGDVVDLDGVSFLTFQVHADDYYISIKHRNHLGVMSGLSYSLSTTATSVGFIYAQTPTYGSDAQQDLNGTTVLWSGNVNGDGVLKYTGSTNDRDPILQAIGGSVPTATLTGYLSGDANMDGVVKYTGTTNDRDIILVNVGGNVPTAVRVEQLP